MKQIFFTITLILTFSTLASDLNNCTKFKSPMNYDMQEDYQYDQTNHSSYFRILFDTGIKNPYLNQNSEKIVRIMLTKDGTAHVHFQQRRYRTFRNDWGHEQREIISTKTFRKFQTRWTYDQAEQLIEVKGVGYGHSAICSSNNPGLVFTYTTKFSELELDEGEQRYLFLGGSTYDVL